MKGTIFNIQKFSTNDGPGIRTTVFLKGCPLKCEWCANPESQSPFIQIDRDDKKCTKCMRCVKLCPTGAISYKNGEFVYDHTLCKDCKRCMRMCPNNALSKMGEYKDSKDIIKECLKDKIFYDSTQGGVTISGGEGLMQPEFLKEILTSLHDEGIHTAIETTGYTQDSVFEDLSQYIDLFLFDMKHYNSKRHMIGTGVNNERILKHLQFLSDHHKDVLVRIPVIPGFNDSLEDACKFSELFHHYHVKDVQLLPFHQLGEGKYHLLHKYYSYSNKKALHEEDLIDYQNIFLNQGIHCFF